MDTLTTALLLLAQQLALQACSPLLVLVLCWQVACSPKEEWQETAYWRIWLQMCCCMEQVHVA